MYLGFSVLGLLGVLGFSAMGFSSCSFFACYWFVGLICFYNFGEEKDIMCVSEIGYNLWLFCGPYFDNGGVWLFFLFLL